jgi:hypothetical protein
MRPPCKRGSPAQVRVAAHLSGYGVNGSTRVFQTLGESSSLSIRSNFMKRLCCLINPTETCRVCAATSCRTCAMDQALEDGCIAYGWSTLPKLRDGVYLCGKCRKEYDPFKGIKMYPVR